MASKLYCAHTTAINNNGRHYPVNYVADESQPPHAEILVGSVAKATGITLLWYNRQWIVDTLEQTISDHACD